MFVRIALAVASLTLALSALGGDVALAAKTDRSSSSSIVLVLLNAPATPTTAVSGPRYGDLVTFNVSTDETAYPFVNLKCYQNGDLVAEGWAGFFDGALGDRTFGLYSPQWTGGAADCTAWLNMYSHGKWRQLVSTSFHVDP
ncbi:MAG: hypothetical protein E6G64_11230 [Actinobacteria bacterium]|nr:MAG: hypothetical protein E6G64_11230 [Actinomycetota bacterium]